MTEIKRYLLVCDCYFIEHQLIFEYLTDEESDEKSLSINIHLTAWENFFQRLVAGIRYAFGHKSRYGEFDNILVSPDEAKNLIEFLQKFIEE